MIFLRYNRTIIEANCYIIADAAEGVALVVDPGAGSADWIQRTLARKGLSLGAILFTHGHIDHVWDGALVAGDAPAYIPEPDLYRMDELSGISHHYQVFAATTGRDWVKPANVQALASRFFVDGGGQIVPGISIRALPTPGHTEGSTIFLLSGSVDDDPESVSFPEGVTGQSLMLSGDVLFRDGVGRTDLPGGDPLVAAESLRTLVRAVDPATVFFPGHGPSSTVGRERAHSYYLREAIATGR
ncbi:MAG: MBL fold metallo-hydrolase [Actinomycetaceae bacterium]|nr:MBL fold metallo-hydrolase [Actinomycetaceae bacterium]